MDETVSAAEAALLLNVSEGFVHGLIREGALSSEGTRLQRTEVLRYRGERAKERESALDEMVALAEEHDLPY